LLFSLKHNNIFPAKPGRRLISYEEKNGICLGNNDIRIIDESRVYSAFGVLDSSFNHLDVSDPKFYFGGKQEFPIEIYEVYQLELIGKD